MSRKSKQTARARKGSAVGSRVAASETQGSIGLDSKQPVELWRQDWLLALLLVIVTMMAYTPAWSGTPIWDDNAHLTKPELRSLDGLARIWTQPGVTQQYYPLLHTLFWLEHQLWGDWPAGYHLLNILLHCGSALLLVRILRQLEIPGAWLAAAIFALHPIQVESVAWISELKNLLSGVFYFGSLLAYLKFDRTRKPGFYAAALALFALGLMSKTVIATLPAAMLVIFWWKRGKLSLRDDLLSLMPFFLLGTAAGLFTAWAERNLVGAEGSDFNYSITERVLIAGRAIWFYLSKFFWPLDLIFVYPRWQVSQMVWWQYLFPAMARAPGRIPLFYRDVIAGTRVPGCLSVPVLACSGPFPVSCVPRDYWARGTRNSLAAQAPAALASSNWLCAVRSITSLVDRPHLASERNVYRHQNALARHDRKKSHGLDGP